LLSLEPHRKSSFTNYADLISYAAVFSSQEASRLRAENSEDNLANSERNYRSVTIERLDGQFSAPAGAKSHQKRNFSGNVRHEYGKRDYLEALKQLNVPHY
jgi:hypothetical protein